MSNPTPPQENPVTSKTETLKTLATGIESVISQSADTLTNISN